MHSEERKRYVVQISGGNSEHSFCIKQGFMPVGRLCLLSKWHSLDKGELERRSMSWFSEALWMLI